MTDGVGHTVSQDDSISVESTPPVINSVKVMRDDGRLCTKVDTDKYTHTTSQTANYIVIRLTETGIGLNTLSFTGVTVSSARVWQSVDGITPGSEIIMTGRSLSTLTFPAAGTAYTFQPNNAYIMISDASLTALNGGVTLTIQPRDHAENNGSIFTASSVITIDANSSPSSTRNTALTQYTGDGIGAGNFFMNASSSFNVTETDASDTTLYYHLEVGTSAPALASVLALPGSDWTVITAGSPVTISSLASRFNEATAQNLYLYIQDAAGNIVGPTTMNNDAVYRDTTAPVGITLATPSGAFRHTLSDTTYFTKTATLDISSALGITTEDGSGIDHYSSQINGIGTKTAISAALASDTNYSIYATDRAQNESVMPTIITITQDSTPPNIKTASPLTLGTTGLVYDTGSYYYRKDANISFGLEDSDCGVSGYYISTAASYTDAAAAALGWISNTGAAVSLEPMTKTGLLYLHYTDNLGNRAATSLGSSAWAFDSSIPDAPTSVTSSDHGVLIGSSWYYNSSLYPSGITLTLSGASDGTTGIRGYATSVPAANTAAIAAAITDSTATTRLVKNTDTQIYSVDQVGNISTAALEVTIVGDSTAPSIGGTVNVSDDSPSSSAFSNGGSVTITATNVLEATSGIKTIVLADTKGAFTNTTPTVTIGGTSVTVTSWTPASGTIILTTPVTVSATATDKTIVISGLTLADVQGAHIVSMQLTDVVGLSMAAAVSDGTAIVYDTVIPAIGGTVNVSDDSPSSSAYSDGGNVTITATGVLEATSGIRTIVLADDKGLFTNTTPTVKIGGTSATVTSWTASTGTIILTTPATVLSTATDKTIVVSDLTLADVQGSHTVSMSLTDDSGLSMASAVSDGTAIVYDTVKPAIGGTVNVNDDSHGSLFADGGNVTITATDVLEATSGITTIVLADTKGAFTNTTPTVTIGGTSVTVTSWTPASGTIILTTPVTVSATATDKTIVISGLTLADVQGAHIVSMQLTDVVGLSMVAAVSDGTAIVYDTVIPALGGTVNVSDDSPSSSAYSDGGNVTITATGVLEATSGIRTIVLADDKGLFTNTTPTVKIGGTSATVTSWTAATGTIILTTPATVLSTATDKTIVVSDLTLADVQGSHTVSMSLTDDSGLSMASAVSDGTAIVYDTVKPAIGGTVNVNDDSHGSLFADGGNVTITATDVLEATSGIKTIVLADDKGLFTNTTPTVTIGGTSATVTSWTASTGTIILTTPATVLSTATDKTIVISGLTLADVQGAHIVSMQLTDVVGLSMAAAVSDGTAIVYDTVIPALGGTVNVSDDSPSSSAYSDGGNVTITATGVLEATSGIRTIVLADDKGLFTNTTPTVKIGGTSATVTSWTASTGTIILTTPATVLSTATDKTIVVSDLTLADVQGSHTVSMSLTDDSGLSMASAVSDGTAIVYDTVIPAIGGTVNVSDDSPSSSAFANGGSVTITATNVLEATSGIKTIVLADTKGAFTNTTPTVTIGGTSATVTSWTASTGTIILTTPATVLSTATDKTIVVSGLTLAAEEGSHTVSMSLTDDSGLSMAAAVSDGTAIVYDTVIPAIGGTVNISDDSLSSSAYSDGGNVTITATDVLEATSGIKTIVLADTKGAFTNTTPTVKIGGTSATVTSWTASTGTIILTTPATVLSTATDKTIVVSDLTLADVQESHTVSMRLTDDSGLSMASAVSDGTAIVYDTIPPDATNMTAQYNSNFAYVQDTPTTAHLYYRTAGTYVVVPNLSTITETGSLLRGFTTASYTTEQATQFSLTGASDTLKIYDNAGKFTTVAVTCTAMTDLVPPDVPTVTLSAAGYTDTANDVLWWKTGATVTFTPTDTGGIYYCVSNSTTVPATGWTAGVTLTPTTYNFTSSLPESSSSLMYLHVRDSYGNDTCKQLGSLATTKLGKDTQGPIIADISTTNELEGSTYTKYYFTLLSTDDGSGIKIYPKDAPAKNGNPSGVTNDTPNTCQYSTNGSTWVETTNSDYIWEYTGSIVREYNHTNWYSTEVNESSQNPAYFKIVAYDNLGNTTTRIVKRTGAKSNHVYSTVGLDVPGNLSIRTTSLPRPETHVTIVDPIEHAALITGSALIYWEPMADEIRNKNLARIAETKIETPKSAASVKLDKTGGKASVVVPSEPPVSISSLHTLALERARSRMGITAGSSGSIGSTDSVSAVGTKATTSIVTASPPISDGKAGNKEKLDISVERMTTALTPLAEQFLARHGIFSVSFVPSDTTVSKTDTHLSGKRLSMLPLSKSSLLLSRPDFAKAWSVGPGLAIETTRMQFFLPRRGTDTELN